MSSILLPDIFAETVYDIDLDALKNEGIRGGICIAEERIWLCV